MRFHLQESGVFAYAVVVCQSWLVFFKYVTRTPAQGAGFFEKDDLDRLTTMEANYLPGWVVKGHH